MNEKIQALTQQLAALKADLIKKEDELKESQARQLFLSESFDSLKDSIAELESEMMKLETTSKVDEKDLSTSDTRVKPSVNKSEVPYPQEKLDGFTALHVLDDEREQMAANVQIIRDSEFFDADWYLNTYPDVKKTDFVNDPAMHYLLYGGFEGRHPGSSFNSVAYFIENPDVYKNQTNPLLHFMLFGLYEERIVYKVVE